MNADYPFKLPRIVGIDGRVVTIEECGKRATFEIKSDRLGQYGALAQSSTFEIVYGRRATVFKMRPFKDERTLAVSEALHSQAQKRPA